MKFSSSDHCGEYKCSQWSASAPFCVAMTTNWKFEKKVLWLKSTSKKVYFKGGDAADVLLQCGCFLWIWMPQLTQIGIANNFGKSKQFHKMTIFYTQDEFFFTQDISFQIKKKYWKCQKWAQ